MKKVCLFAFLGVVWPGVAGTPFAERAVHLDLARQMETVDFVCDYIDLVADSGYTAIWLYFEGRLRTPTTQVLPDAETYSAEDVRRIRAKAASRGLKIIPGLETLGHCEHFFRSGKYRHLSEERDGDGRWPVKNPSTFCPSLPEAKEFLARYLGEVAAMFPESELIDVDMDEAWHMGFCKLCRERRKTEGFGGIFARHVEFIESTLAKLGRRMRMADDFYEFFPEKVAECPRSVSLDSWIYDRTVSRWGHRGHFAQRIRLDTLRRYRELGFAPSIATCSLWYDYNNIRSLTEYAAAAGCPGMAFSQWEMFDRGHGPSVPVIAATGAYWRDPDAFAAKDFDLIGLGKTWPKLTVAEREAIRPALHLRLYLPQTSVGQTLNLDTREDQIAMAETAIAAFRRSVYAPAEKIAPRQLSPEALADDFVTQLRLHFVREKLRLIGPSLASPRRTPGRVKAARAELASVRKELEAIRARRLAQQAAWRPDCLPQDFAKPAEDGLKTVAALAAYPETADEDEWWLEFDLSMPEYHMHPFWSVLVRVDGTWRTVAGGYWKAGTRDWANFERIEPFRLKGRPTALRIEYRGRGACSLNYATVENRRVRLVPRALVRTEGLVTEPQNLLTDNWKSCRFGWPDTLETIHAPALQDLVSAVEFSLAEDNHGLKTAAIR